MCHIVDIFSPNVCLFFNETFLYLLSDRFFFKQIKILNIAHVFPNIFLHALLTVTNSENKSLIVKSLQAF